MLCIDFHRNWLRTGGEKGYYFLIGGICSSIPTLTTALYSIILVSFDASRRDLSNAYNIVFHDGRHLILFDLKKNIHYSRHVSIVPISHPNFGKKFFEIFYPLVGPDGSMNCIEYEPWDRFRWYPSLILDFRFFEITAEKSIFSIYPEKWFDSFGVMKDSSRHSYVFYKSRPLTSGMLLWMSRSMKMMVVYNGLSFVEPPIIYTCAHHIPLDLHRFSSILVLNARGRPLWRRTWSFMVHMKLSYQLPFHNPMIAY